MDGRTIFRKLIKGYKNQKKKEPEESLGYPVFLPPQIIPPVAKPETEEKKTPQEIEGIEIPDFKTKRVSTRGIEKEDVELIKMVYPLIPGRPKKDEKIMAYAKIEWNPKKNTYEYNVVQPELPKRLQKLLSRVREMLEQRLDIDFSRLNKVEAKEYLHRQTFKLIKYLSVKLSETERDILEYHINKEFLGLGKIEPLMHDPEIEDISCDGVNIPIYVFHRNPKLGSIPTNLVFEDNEKLDTYLVRLAQICGQSISVIDPLLGGTLPDGSRIQGTLGTDIAKKGSNFTIRKFTMFPFTPTHLLDYETVDIKTLAFLWLAIDYGASVLVSGGVATGKTSFLNVLSLFIKPTMKIVSIEDTAEIRLTHEHWIPHVARVPIATERGRTRGEIDLFDLLKESLRQRPDYIIVGEVRGREAYVLFQQMATGHASLATIHSETMDKLISRLITPPIELPPSLMESLDLIVFLTKMRYRGKYVRKLKNLHEVIGFDIEKNRPLTNNIIDWNALTNKFVTKNKSTLLRKIAKKSGVKEKDIVEELKRRMVVLYWMKEQNILDYRDVSRIIRLYYNYPENVLETISGEL